ncbi:hypothetical protein SAMN05216332_1092 [Nitrosospira briensis]|nr:hypothetical protein SAMN05216332_1092 [Nitrosospira briensis]
MLQKSCLVGQIIQRDRQQLIQLSNTTTVIPAKAGIQSVTVVVQVKTPRSPDSGSGALLVKLKQLQLITSSAAYGTIRLLRMTLLWPFQTTSVRLE